MGFGEARSGRLARYLERLEPQFNKAFNGEPGGSLDALLPMQRHGYTEECYFDFTFTPVFGQTGTVDGVFNAVIETTYRVISERRNSFLQKLSKALGGAKSLNEVCSAFIATTASNRKDIPFALLYSASQGGDPVFLDGTECNEVKLKRNWPFGGSGADADALHIQDVNDYLFDVPQGPWPEAPKEAFIVPLKENDGRITGFMVLGVSSRRALDGEYRSFFESVGASLSTVINTIGVLQEERKRAEALAELDREKTLFFSNISHEFRTPLTLILGSLEGMLRKPGSEIGAEDAATLETTHRNAMRLLRLVNNLLDFSRIEAGREKASFRKTDLAQFTKGLASSFSSLMQNAGLSYYIDIEPINEPVYVDKLMWEKIVFNILSNAFKYTLEGAITISLRKEKEAVKFTVRDTGVGIPKEEIPKMFERFHRVQNVGRTFEGTGIGLSLVNELVKLHGGTISVESELGRGTEVTIAIPIGKEHLPADQISEQLDTSNDGLAESFLEEAASLIQTQSALVDDKMPFAEKRSGKILVVDDNPDMRGYIKTLLQNRSYVTTATDGKDALEKIESECPDLVVSDIMMPVMDGVALMKTLKAQPGRKQLPVILLSARAGEEARIEGFETGADDYLVKPFSAKELIARISSQINLTKSRKEIENTLRNVILQSPMATVLLRGPSFIIEIVNDLGLEIWGRSYDEVINKPIAQALPEVAAQGFDKLLEQVYSTGEAYIGNETPVELRRYGKPQTVFLNFIYSPFRDSENNVIGIIAVGIDVTEQVNARRLVEEAKSRLANAIELGELGTWDIDLNTGYTHYSARVADWWGLPINGAPLADVINCIHPDDQENVNAAVHNAIDQSGKYQAGYRLINAVSKQERFIEANGNVTLGQDGKPVKLSGIVKDVTMQRNARQELQRQVLLRTKELEMLNIELQRSNSELLQFAYVASHDLQEPLRKIQTFSDMVKRNWSNEVAAKIYLDKIAGSAARMSSLIKDVLLYSEVSNKGQKLEWVNLNEVFRSVKMDFELVMEEKGAVVQADDLPTIRCNKPQLYQLFSNLIGNSLKFCQGRPIIKVRHTLEPGTNIKEKAADPAKLYHTLIFKDNGIGFDQIHSDQIFKLFNRLHDRKEYSGTGIGLALCKKIVENHNGIITAHSVKGQGATFVVYIPMEN